MEGNEDEKKKAREIPPRGFHSGDGLLSQTVAGAVGSGLRSFFDVIPLDGGPHPRASWSSQRAHITFGFRMDRGFN